MERALIDDNKCKRKYLETPLIYSNLKEKNIKEFDWTKKTLKYIEINNSRVKSIIKSKINYRKKYYLTSLEEEDIYQNFLLYMSGKKDYEDNHISNEDGKKVSMEKYVSISLHKYIVRHCHDKYKDKKETISTDEMPLYMELSSKEDELYDGRGTNLTDIIRNIEWKRYKYNIDMFMFLYIKKYAEIENIDQKTAQLFITKNISKNADLKGLEKDNQVIDMIKELSFIDDLEQIKILRKFVYGYRNIEKALKYISKEV